MNRNLFKVIRIQKVNNKILQNKLHNKQNLKKKKRVRELKKRKKRVRELNVIRHNFKAYYFIRIRHMDSNLTRNYGRSC
jgi:hypothetical protein